MAVLNDIYSHRILELAANIPRAKPLEAPDASARAHSKLCGSTVSVDLKMEGDVVTDYGQQVKACLLGQASSSIMGHHVIGSWERATCPPMTWEGVDALVGSRRSTLPGPGSRWNRSGSWSWASR